MVCNPITLSVRQEDAPSLKYVSRRKAIDLYFDYSEKVSISLEYFPPKTDQGLTNLMGRIESMQTISPKWVNCTWGAGGSTASTTFDICETALTKLGMDVMMHLTCTNMEVSKIDEVLCAARRAGIRNIMALRGDPPMNQSAWVATEGGFAHAADLVRYIRKTHGDWFCVGVAGYPEGHVESSSMEADLMHLKAKVEAGADLIVTQLFYDNSLFYDYVARVRAMGVTVPILPGLMPISTYAGFLKMTAFCKTHVPSALRERLELVKENEVAVRALGVSVAVEMCRDLVSHGHRHIHLYTLNSEANIREIIDTIQMEE